MQAAGWLEAVFLRTTPEHVMRRPEFPILRTAAHARHQIVSASLWWWCPPMHAISSMMHREVVDMVYDGIEGKDEDHAD